MSADQKHRRVDVGFGEWLGIVCKHDPLAYPRLLCVVLLLVAAAFLGMHNLLVGYSLFFGLGAAFLWAFHHAWRLALENPPWYLKEARKCQS